MLVRTFVKEEEKRVFFEFAGRPPREGEPRDRIPFEQEEAEAKLARLDWEKKNGIRLLNFHYDPYAGGLQPLAKPKGQVIKDGRVLDPMGNVAAIVPGNLSKQPKGVTEMRPIGMWTGEWL